MVLSSSKHVHSFCDRFDRSDHIADVVSEMTYTVSSGTLNSSIPYHTTKPTVLNV